MLSSGKGVIFFHKILSFEDIKEECFWKHTGNRRKSRLQTFSPLLQCIPTFHLKNFLICATNALILDCSKFLMFGKGLTHTYTIQSKKTFENIEGKRENFGKQHFLLFQQCILFYHRKILLFKSYLSYNESTFCFSAKGLTHSQTMTPFDAPGRQAFWKHCGKRRNCS